MKTLKERISGFAGKFAFHLSDTHGYPVEEFKNKLSSLTYKQFFNLVGSHKDFYKQLKQCV